MKWAATGLAASPLRTLATLSAERVEPSSKVVVWVILARSPDLSASSLIIFRISRRADIRVVSRSLFSATSMSWLSIQSGVIPFSAKAWIDRVGSMKSSSVTDSFKARAVGLNFSKTSRSLISYSIPQIIILSRLVRDVRLRRREGIVHVRVVHYLLNGVPILEGHLGPPFGVQGLLSPSPIVDAAPTSGGKIPIAIFIQPS
jgi:hypothetical protein